jgi:energy-coupling factor transporter transmembrane protein EcfT
MNKHKPIFNIVKLLGFFCYTIAIFFFSGWFLLPFLALDLVFYTWLKIKPLTALRYIAGLLPFILFAAVFNLLMGDWRGAVWLSLRLILVCGLTQSFRRSVSSEALADAVETLFRPAALLGGKKHESLPRDIGLMVAISMAFIPVLRRDFGQITLALRAKGMKFSFRNFKYAVRPFFTGVFKRTDEISRALAAKGYM